ncbi:MAG: geranylgeranylglycerol-phosphate geranylgeranyltransferase [Bacteroidia bacterium]|nr:geranylgeranylglycerol-phosphate geranylgeranyltransferase [Bacteroidia bacterium]
MQIIDFFKLIRYKNLLIIILTQYLMRWCVIFTFIDPIVKVLDPAKTNLLFSEGLFALLVLSTVCIAAAGYAINDYFDVRVDTENHPDTVLVGTKISRRMAMTINNIFNFIGVALGFYISYKIGLFNLGFLFAIISGGLWFYSALYKRQLIIGNLIIALFAGLVPLLTVIFEIPSLNKVITPDRPPVETTIVSVLFLYIAGYSAFAFLTTLAREILKDIEDLKGDNLVGRRTIPVVFGIKSSKVIVITLLTIILILLGIIYYYYFRDYISLTYLLVTIALPTIYLIYKLIKANEKGQYHYISTGIKGIMLAGLVFSVLLRFIIE